MRVVVAQVDHRLRLGLLQSRLRRASLGTLLLLTFSVRSLFLVRFFRAAMAPRQH